jgi:hypothetical protein
LTFYYHRDSISNSYEKLDQQFLIIPKTFHDTGKENPFFLINSEAFAAE